MTEAEELARREAMEMHAQLGGTRRALTESNDEAQFLRRQNQQLQAERSELLARLERVETLLAERTPLPSRESHAMHQGPSPKHYPYMLFSPDHAGHNATVQMSLEPNRPVPTFLEASQPVEQSAERVAQPTRLQAFFEGAALGAPQLGGRVLLPHNRDVQVHKMSMHGLGILISLVQDPQPLRITGIRDLS